MRPRDIRRTLEIKVPGGVVGKAVEVGWSRASLTKEPRQAVCAFFNRAGRLCYRRDTKRDGTRRKSSPIAYSDVEFGRKLCGLGQKGVRSEVLRALLRRYAPRLLVGEV